MTRDKKSIPRYKKCSSCKGSGVCKVCHGEKQERIINSRSKGASFERRISKLFTAWCGFELKRSPGSGAWGNNGDIVPKDPAMATVFPFSVECKCTQQWKITDFINIDKEDNTLVEYWNQCISDAAEYNKIPMLVFKRISEPEYCFVWRPDWLNLCRHNIGLRHGQRIITDKFVIFPLKHLFKAQFCQLVTTQHRGLIEAHQERQSK